MKGNLNKELTSRLQNNDIDAFNSLYSKYHPAIYNNVLKLTRDCIATEDIVQEVFICLWEKRHDLDPELEIAGWLFVVSYNKSVNHLKGKLKESLQHTGLHLQFQDTLDSEDNGVDAQVILEKAIEQLSPQRRKVFELCKLQSRTYEEAAEELQLSKHTVKEYLSGAVISIKEYVKQHPKYSATILCAALVENFFS